MNFKDSASISIPLSDPIIKHGNGYKVVSVFLVNSSESSTYSNVPESSNDRAFFVQDFDSSSLDLRWYVEEPFNGEVYKGDEKLRKDRYISGFDVSIYKNNRDLIGEGNASDRSFIRKYTGISGNSFRYDIEDFSIRNYSVDIDLYDHFGNEHTATLITKNPEASAEILSYEDVGGVLDIQYSGSENLEYLKVSNYSGLLESSFHECYTGSNNTVSVPLIPNLPNYLKIEPYDGFGYSKPISMSGYSLEEEKSFPFKLKIKSVKLNKKDGGRSIEFDMKANFESNPYVSAKYKVSTSGSMPDAEVGYDGEIYLDNGEFNNTELNIKNTGFNYTIDNQFTWQNNILASSLNNSDSNPSYAYWDNNSQEMLSLSLYDVRSGEMPVRGIFSMPINQPNSYDIKFRNGINFRGEYEKASSYLKSIGEMPAVILNESQANKLKSYSGAVGWVGLRKGNVGLLDQVFSENSINQNIFKSVDFESQTTRIFSYQNKKDEYEEINYVSNDIGENWGWVNSSGSHIYKYIQEDQYNPETYFKFNIEAESTISNDATSIERKLFVMPADLSRMSGSISGDTISIDYTMKDGDSVESIELYTGQTSDFIVSEESLAQQYTYEEDSSIDYTIDIKNPPKYIKAEFQDFLGNTETIDINKIYYESQGENEVDELRFIALSGQDLSISLDDLVGGETRRVEARFPVNHESEAKMEFLIGYSGQTEEPEFLNAMMVGPPTVSGADFILDKVPPEDGYFMDIRST